jgi:hypothetical protein
MYQDSFNAIHTVLGFYQQMFHKEFGAMDHDELFIQDIASIIQRVTHVDGSINISELVYFIGIGFERLHQDLIHVKASR